LVESTRLPGSRAPGLQGAWGRWGSPEVPRRLTVPTGHTEGCRATASSCCCVDVGTGRLMGRVDDDEVLLLWRAVLAFRGGPHPRCAPEGQGAARSSACPLFDRCPRWDGPDDYRLSLDEDFEVTEQRRATWPCSRLLDLLTPDTTRIGR